MHNCSKRAQKQSRRWALEILWLVEQVFPDLSLWVRVSHCRRKEPRKDEQRKNMGKATQNFSERIEVPFCSLVETPLLALWSTNEPSANMSCCFHNTCYRHGRANSGGWTWNSCCLGEGKWGCTKYRRIRESVIEQSCHPKHILRESALSSAPLKLALNFSELTRIRITFQLHNITSTELIGACPPSYLSASLTITSPICITMLVPFASRNLFTSIRIRGCWHTSQ